MKDMAFIRFILDVIYTRKILYTSYSPPAACTRRKVHSRVISDSDVSEVDPDMQMSVLNSVLLSILAIL